MKKYGSTYCWPILALLVTVSLIPQKLRAQGCLAYFDTIPEYAEGDNGYLNQGERYKAGNPDSVLVDTCLASLTHGRLYIKRTLDLYFDSDYFQIRPTDSEVVLSSAELEQKYSGVSTILEPLIHRIGQFSVKKVSPADSGTFRNRLWQLTFDQYALQDSVGRVAASLVHVTAQIHNGLERREVGSVERTTGSASRVHPNPVRSILTLGDDPLLNVTLTDLSGNVVGIWHNVQVIDLSLFSPGAYALQTERGSSVIIVK